MIARREKFQRVYNLRERILPGFNETTALPTEEARDELAARSVRALGLVPARWVPDYFRIPKLGIGPRMARLVEQGRVLPVSVEGWKEPAYLHPEDLPLLERAANGALPARYTTLMAPFDPLVSERARAKELFDFDFSIECYLPAPKRRYGYFLLPILHNGELVGRLDAKAHRKDGLFEVKALYLEPRVHPSEELAVDLADALQRCASWHRTPRVEIRQSEPADFASLVSAKLASG
jgi:uncharacterized protein